MGWHDYKPMTRFCLIALIPTIVAIACCVCAVFSEIHGQTVGAAFLWTIMGFLLAILAFLIVAYMAEN